MAVGVVALAAFGWLQVRRVRHGRSPLVDPSILRRRPYVAGLAVVVGFIGAMGGMLIALNVMFQTGLGYSPLACGVATVAIPLAAIGGSITSSALLDRLGRTTMHIGVVVMALGLGVVSTSCCASVGGGVTAWDLAAPLALTGFGMGMVFVPMFDVILAGVAPHQLGSASGLLESVQQLAMSLGIAAVGTVLFDSLGHGFGPAAFVGAADHALLVAIGFLVCAGGGGAVAAQARARALVTASYGRASLCATRRGTAVALAQAGQHFVAIRGEERVLVGSDLVDVELVEAGIGVRLQGLRRGAPRPARR